MGDSIQDRLQRNARRTYGTVWSGLLVAALALALIRPNVSQSDRPLFYLFLIGMLVVDSVVTIVLIFTKIRCTGCRKSLAPWWRTFRAGRGIRACPFCHLSFYEPYR